MLQVFNRYHNVPDFISYELQTDHEVQNYFNLYFTALEKPQAGTYFPTPLIHSLGEKKKQNKTKES